MIRRRFQNGCLTVKGKGQKMWVARWRETMLQPDNTLSKVLRSKVLGPVSMISKSEARSLLQTVFVQEIRVRSAHLLHSPSSNLQRRSGNRWL